MPEISVLMSVYNSNDEDMLRLAVDSILHQTYQDFEFIICDDGSTDGTLETIKKIVNNDGRVVLIQNIRNSGLAYSLNYCLSIAKGKYIARMDADDISLPMRLYKQIEFLDNNSKYILVGCNAELFDDKNGRWGLRKKKEKPQKEDFLFGSAFIHPTILIRTEILKGLSGYRVCKETLRAEDYDLFMRMYADGYLGYNIQEPLYRFREDNAAFNRRSYKYRLDEAKVRYYGFKKMGILAKSFPYIIKPLIVGLIPQQVLKILRSENI